MSQHDREVLSDMENLLSTLSPDDQASVKAEAAYLRARIQASPIFQMAIAYVGAKLAAEAPDVH
jgi:hypothetical protein